MTQNVVVAGRRQLTECASVVLWYWYRSKGDGGFVFRKLTALPRCALTHPPTPNWISKKTTAWMGFQRRFDGP